MFDRLREKLLPLLRVPPEPEAPNGAPGSIRVFRAAPNFYKLKLAVWTLGQVATLAGIIFSLAFLANLKSEADYIRSERQAAAAAAKAAAADPGSQAAAEATPDDDTESPASPARPRFKPRFKEIFRIPTAFLRDPHNPFGRLFERSPWWLFPGIALLEFFGVAFYLLQLPVTYALVRLEYESHWYIVTDRSLRIRWGLITMREATMSFANIQQVTVSQGPLQRLLGLSDVHVQSAGGGGGGGGETHKGGDRDSMHEGVFHGVTNATEIRDLILDRLRRFRAAGLGDPEDSADDHAPSAAPSVSSSSDTLDAARSLLAEARELRKTLT